MQRPRPRAWPEEISLEEYAEFTPEKIELVQGNLLDSEDARLDPLAVLLRNCGLEAVALLCDKEDWHEAADRAGHNM